MIRSHLRIYAVDISSATGVLVKQNPPLKDTLLCLHFSLSAIQSNRFLLQISPHLSAMVKSAPHPLPQAPLGLFLV